MKNQVLSIEQMRKLKELGVDTSKASMAVYNIYAGEQKEYDILAANGAFAEKQEHDRFGYGIHNVVSFDKKPVFTLQDLIELLPKSIIINSVKHWFCVNQNCLLTEFQVMYFDGYDSYGVIKQNKSLLQAAYNMLIWVAENGYLKTK